MRINNYFFNNFIYKDKNIFKEGSVFKGQILDIFEDEVLLEIKEYGTIKANLDNKTEININDEITFLVKSCENEIIEIKPILTEGFEERNTVKDNNNERLIDKLLVNLNNKNINIKDSKLSSELIKSLMENNVKLSEENLINSIKILDKLIDLLSLDEDKKVIFLEGKNNSEENINSDNIKEVYSKKITEDNIKLKEFIPNKSHIKHLLITDKDSYTDKKDLTSMVKEFLLENEDIKSEEFPKIISFIIKNNIKPSLNNIQNIRKLNNDPEGFLKEFTTIKENFKEFIKNNIGKKDFINKTKLLQENLEDDKILKINGFKELEEIVEEIKTLKNYNFKEEISLFKDKMDFLKEINKDLSFMFIPLNYEPDSLKGVVNFLKEKDKKTRNGKINVFISLNTKTLGDIKVSCELYMKNINVKINIDKRDLKLFQSQEDKLTKKILDIGYNLNKIDYVFDEDLNLIDQIVFNESPRYLLDIKV